MKKILSIFLSATIALFLSSCFEYETEITINKDGSGTITDEMLLSAQMVGMMEMAEAQGGQQQTPLDDMKDEGKMKEKATAYGEGVTFLKTENIKRPDGSKGIRATFQFTDINKVPFSPNSGMSQLSEIKPGPKAEKAAAEVKATFAYADGKLSIQLPQSENGEMGEEEQKDAEKFDPQDPQMAMMTEMMRGMKMSAKVTLADGIAETNATHHADGSITLFEFDFDEVMKNPDGLNALSEMNSKNPEAISKALAKIKGAKAETQKEITATVK